MPARLTRIALLLLAGAAGCGTPPGSDGERGRDGEPRHAAAPEDQRAIREGYLERLRLGLGGPFRLIDLALSDPRLDVGLADELAAELLRRTARGELYEIDPAVLLPASVPARERVEQAWGHLELIESVVAEADEPDAGELTIRLAYRLAAMEGQVDEPLVRAAVAVAALARDREVAIRDARRLIAAARQSRARPADLVRPWRETRQLLVERPVAPALPGRLQLQALRSTTGVVGAIRGIVHGRRGASASRLRISDEPEPMRRLVQLADSMDMPPRAPLVVALRGVGSALPASLDATERAAWARFEAAALDEERYVARRSELLARQPRLRTAIAAAGLYAAVGMRPDAQERAWFPGSDAPTLEALRAEHGLSVVVGEGVPQRWVPYFAGLLEEAHADLRSVIPGIALFGLNVELGRESESPRALASYRSRTRTIRWPVTTGPGTLAHEVAHHLDAQAATRRIGGTPGYASESRAFPPPPSFRAAVAFLAPTGPVTVGLPAWKLGHAQRPAEIAARAFDWFVVTRLAEAGRWNGALSSAQDELFTGNGSLGPPGVGPGYAPAVIEVVRSLAAIPREHRAGFLAEYGRLRWPTPYPFLAEVAARLDEVERSAPARSPMGMPTATLDSIAAVRDEMLRLIDVSRCQGAIPLLDIDLHREYRRLVINASLASARVTAVEAASELGGEDAEGWMTGELYGLPWLAPEEPPAELALLEAIAASVREMRATSAPLFRSGFVVSAPAGGCAPAPALLGSVLAR